MEENRDYLIILDACRYDYFVAMWKNYFDEDLEKRVYRFFIEMSLKSLIRDLKEALSHGFATPLNEG